VSTLDTINALPMGTVLEVDYIEREYDTDDRHKKTVLMWVTEDGTPKRRRTLVTIDGQGAAPEGWEITDFRVKWGPDTSEFISVEDAAERAIKSFRPFGGDDELSAAEYRVYEEIRQSIRAEFGVV
jgi:hypothetical protein